MTFFVCLLALAVPLDPAVLIETVIAHEKAESLKRQKYTHREDSTKIHFDKQGKESARDTETFEVLFLEGAPYRKLILENGKPLAAKKQAKVEADLAKEKLRRTGERRNGLIHRTVRLGSIAQASKFYSLAVTEDSLAGRTVWKLEGTPRTGVPAESEEEKNALKTKRTWWIDPEDKAVVREKTEFLEATNGVQPGSVLLVDLENVNGECWLPTRTLLTYDLQIAKFIRAKGSHEVLFRDYKKFEVDSSVVFDEVK